MALDGKVGEFVEVFQWITPEQSQDLSPQQRQRLAGELGDVFIYLMRLADFSGVDLLASVDAVIVLSRAHILPGPAIIRSPWPDRVGGPGITINAVREVPMVGVIIAQSMQ